MHGERADGNAFYVEELVKMLIEDDVIETGEPWDPWRVHVERLDPERVPPTLTGVLQTRLDSLAVADREALQRSSVVGRVFWDGAVDALGRDDLAATISSLELARSRELVFRNPLSSFDDTVEYTFKHALLRDVTYEAVLLRDRRRLHGLVARWVSDHAGERVSEHSALIASHLRSAGNLAAAADLLHRTAARLLDAGNSPAARRNLEEAFELWRADGQAPTVEALTTMAEACVRSGDIHAAHRYGEAALARPAPPELRARAMFLGSWIASEQGDHERERTLLDEVMPEAERIGGVLLGRVLNGLAWSHTQRGDLEAAKVLAARCRSLAEQLQSPVVSREVIGMMGVIAGMEGDLRGSLDLSGEALAVAERIGDLEGQALAHSNLGVARHLLGDAEGSVADYHAAFDHYERVRELNRRLGRLLQNGMAAANMAQVQIRLGDDAATQQLLREAISTLHRSGGTVTMLFCVLAEADRRLTTGDVTRGLELIGLVQHHPACTTDNVEEIGRILGRTGLTPDAVAPAIARGADQDLAATVDQLLVELTSAVD